jgi:hypothetical protein
VQPQSLRTTLIFAAVAAGIWSLISLLFVGDSPLTVLLTAPFFFAIIFFTMRFTNRLTTWILNRSGAAEKAEARRRERQGKRPVPGPAEQEMRTDRPDHVRRRRERRGRRRRR